MTPINWVFFNAGLAELEKAIEDHARMGTVQHQADVNRLLLRTIKELTREIDQASGGKASSE